jgi:hypothetical protein
MALTVKEMRPVCSDVAHHFRQADASALVNRNVNLFFTKLRNPKINGKVMLEGSYSCSRSKSPATMLELKGNHGHDKRGRQKAGVAP